MQPVPLCRYDLYVQRLRNHVTVVVGDALRMSPIVAVCLFCASWQFTGAGDSSSKPETVAEMVERPQRGLATWDEFQRLAILCATRDIAEGLS
jgi:hypothetical protein